MNIRNISIPFLKSKDQRSRHIDKNIAGIFLIKGANIAITFLLFPLTIHYISPHEYGIWLTLSSIIGWLNYFDFGLSNGLRNRLAESLSKNDIVLSKILISTTYGIILLGIAAISVIVIPAIYFIDWRNVLNAPQSNKNELMYLAYIVFISFSLRFFFQVINTVLMSIQRPALSNLSGLLSNLLTLILVLLLKYTLNPSIIALGIVFGLSPILVYMFYSVVFFSTSLRNIAPSFLSLDIKYSRMLFSLGIRFFIIQIAGVVLFSLTNILISNYFNPISVTIYNVAYKYFSTVYMIFNMVMTPYWSAFTEAYIKDDLDWIKSSMRRLKRLWVVFVFIALLMLSFSEFFFKIWMGKTITIPFSLSITFTLYFILNSYSAIYVVFINGISKIRLSIIQALFEMVIFLPLVHVLIKIVGLDIYGIVVAMSISPIIVLTWMPIQVKKIINKQATGIWNK